MLKVKKCSYHLLQAVVISFFVTLECQKIQKNEMKTLTEEFFIVSELLEEFQSNFQ